MMDETKIQDILFALFDSCADADADVIDNLADITSDILDFVDSDESIIHSVGTFADAGLMTAGSGVVIQLKDGSEYKTKRDVGTTK